MFLHFLQSNSNFKKRSQTNQDLPVTWMTMFRLTETASSNSVGVVVHRKPLNSNTLTLQERYYSGLEGYQRKARVSFHALLIFKA
jgi:hypothetical protein